MSRTKNNFSITYYDFANLNYASFFLYGFLENESKFNYKFIVEKSAPKILLELNLEYAWREILTSLCLFKVDTTTESYYFCIDTRDSNSVDLNYGMGFHLPLLTKVKYYFKVNYNKNIIRNDRTLNGLSDKIFPILPFFPIKFNKWFIYNPRLIPRPLTNWNLYELKERLKFNLRNLTVDEMINFRHSQKNYDIFFVTMYRQSKTHENYNEFRYQIISEIQKYTNLKTITGFTGSNLSGKFSTMEVQPLYLKQYLAEQAKSKVAIYVRGLHDCISFKFAQYLAMGMPIIGQTITNNTDNLMKNDYFDLQFSFNDPKEIVHNAVEIINQPELLAKLGKSNAEAFDQYFRPEIVIKEILEKIIY